jgi:sugar/nucleoside kinase (ribokinase family)
MTAARAVVIGYASLDSSTSTPEFRGLDATSILERPLVAAEPSAGGIAHIVRAVRGTGAGADAVSWVGADSYGSRWAAAIRETGSGLDGIAVFGTRTPAATLIEVATGGTICLFDPGDCHLDRLTPEQVDLIASSAIVLLTVAPTAITRQVLDILPSTTRLVWAVKRDEHAYPPSLVERLLARADVVSFSRGERPWLTRGPDQPETRAKGGALVIETRGPDGVAWCFAGESSRPGSIAVERISADDTTGAGDTFIGTVAGLAASVPDLTALSDPELVTLVTSASTAAGDVLRRRTTTGPGAGVPQKETLHVD